MKAKRKLLSQAEVSSKAQSYKKGFWRQNAVRQVCPKPRQNCYHLQSDTFLNWFSSFIYTQSWTELLNKKFIKPTHMMKSEAITLLVSIVMFREICDEKWMFLWVCRKPPNCWLIDVVGDAKYSVRLSRFWLELSKLHLRAESVLKSSFVIVITIAPNDH